MRYRIKQRIYKNNKIEYLPQVKYFLIWTSLSSKTFCSTNGGVGSCNVWLNDIEFAMNLIEKHKSQTIISISIIKYD